MLIAIQVISTLHKRKFAQIADANNVNTQCWLAGCLAIQRRLYDIYDDDDGDDDGVIKLFQIKRILKYY